MPNNVATPRDVDRLYRRFSFGLDAAEARFLGRVVGEPIEVSLRRGSIKNALSVEWTASAMVLANAPPARLGGPGWAVPPAQRPEEERIAGVVREAWRAGGVAGAPYGRLAQQREPRNPFEALNGLNAVQRAAEWVRAGAAVNGGAPKMKTVIRERKPPEASSLVDEVWGVRGAGHRPRELREGMLLSLPPAQFPYDHCMGLEVEVEDAKVEDGTAWRLVMEGWDNKPDGSLRNGTEYVTKLGLTAGDCISYMEPLQVLLSEAKFSFRCGLHTHVDVTTHTLEELYRVFLVYSVVEPLLFEISGQRYSNKFCCGVQDSRNAVASAIHYGQQKEWGQFTRMVSSGSKYMAMNILPVHSFGSLEFRQHEGTADPAKVSKWLHVLGDLCCHVKEVKTTALEESILGLNTTSEYSRFLAVNFPSSFKWLADVDGYRKKMYPGVMYIKECFASDPELK